MQILGRVLYSLVKTFVSARTSFTPNRINQYENQGVSECTVNEGGNIITKEVIIMSPLDTEVYNAQVEREKQMRKAFKAQLGKAALTAIISSFGERAIWKSLIRKK